MTIFYPLALPDAGFKSVRLTARDVVGMGQSPFTLTQQVQQHQGQRWEADIEIPPMIRADAEAWITFLLKLKGQYGTCLVRDGASGTPRGDWSGTPLVDGAHAAAAAALNIKGLTPFATLKAGDFLQVGSGTSTRLHKILDDVTADSGGLATVDLWPSLREALSDGASIVTSNAVGTFRLASNERSWDIGLAQIYGLRFTVVEAL